MKEHQDPCKKGETEKSAVAEHAWSNQHSILWEETTIIDRARRQKELKLKEVLYISLTQDDQHFNKNVGLELPACWIATLKRMNIELSLPS